MTTGPFPFPSPDGTPVTPLPVAGDAREVLLFGGTFDPPHAAHLRLALEARGNLIRMRDRGWLVFVPAAQNPLKLHGPVASDVHRVEMLRLLLAPPGQEPAPRTLIWTDEIDRARTEPGPTYTVDTVRRLRTILPNGAKVRLLLGSDQAADFHRWKEARRLFNETSPLVLLRTPHNGVVDLAAAIRATQFWSAAETSRWLQRIPTFTIMDIAATQIRERLRTDRSDPALRDLLTPAVYDYIQSHGLYR